MVNTRILAQDFEYLEPSTVKEVASLLEKHGDKAKVLAGGTDLIVKMKKGEVNSGYLINIGKIKGLDFIKEGGGLSIGAATKLRSVEKSDLIREKYLVLFEAVKALGKVQARNMGTIGGNICNASPAADSAPALLVLGAQVRAMSSNGTRTIPLEEFFKGPGKTTLSPNELLTEIQIPSPPKSSGGAFLKIARVSADLAKINAAAAIERKGDICKSCRIALGAVAPTPLRIKRAEETLNGKKFDENIVEESARIVSEDIKPITDVRSTAEYRREVSKWLTENVLKTAWERSRR